jgi:glycosyltransferase involved in cell wall biosynthesis
MFVLPNLGGGGAARVIVTLLRHLDRERFEPHLVVLDTVWPYLRDVPSDVAVHALLAGRVRRALPRLLATMWRLRPTVIVSTQGYLNLALLTVHPLLPPAKLVVREVIGFGASRYRAFFYGWYLRVVGRADRIVTQSDAAARAMASRLGAGQARIVRLYNPVDLSRLGDAARSGPRPFADAGPHLLAVGRLHPQKGFDLLLDAFGGVRQAGIPATLTVLGDGGERTALEAQAQRLGIAATVRFVGFQEQPYPYFGHADLFVLSSRYEGMPNVVLEALACGCPVVAFECPHGVNEIIRHEVNGLLVPPEDVGGMRAALERLLRSPDERGRLRAQIPSTLAPFAVSEVVRGWETLFDELTHDLT